MPERLSVFASRKRRGTSRSCGFQPQIKMYGGWKPPLQKMTTSERGDEGRLLSDWNGDRSTGKISSFGRNTVASGHLATRSKKERRQPRLRTATRMLLIRLSSLACQRLMEFNGWISGPTLQPAWNFTNRLKRLVAISCVRLKQANFPARSFITSRHIAI